VSESTSTFDLDSDILKFGNVNYSWTVSMFNGDEEAFSETWTFTTIRSMCDLLFCDNGGYCNETTLKCVCQSGFGGEHCTISIKATIPLLFVILGSVAGAIIIAVVIAFTLILFLCKKRRKKVAQTKVSRLDEMRFVPFSKVSKGSKVNKEIEQFVRQDVADCAFAVSLLSKVSANEIDVVSRGLIYAYEHEGRGCELVKALISREIVETQSCDTLFRRNSPATAMFKYYSRMVGLRYLSQSLGETFRSIVQHDIDNEEIRIATRDSEVALDLMSDTYEVDPSRVGVEDDEANDALQLGATQLQLIAQRIFNQILQSVDLFPS
jgi:hypothetical protein